MFEKGGESLPPEKKRRRRNYAAMHDDKLLMCIDQLDVGAGAAYIKCLESGSGDPEGDLLYCYELMQKREDEQEALESELRKLDYLDRKTEIDLDEFWDSPYE